MTQIHVRAVVRATKVSVPVSAAPKEKVVAVIRAVHQITSVETAGSVVSFRVISRIRHHRHRHSTIAFLGVSPVRASAVHLAWCAVAVLQGNQIARHPASVNG